MPPHEQDGLPWWQQRFALEGLNWEASVQADKGDVWPDEHFRSDGGLDELEALGVQVKRVG